MTTPRPLDRLSLRVRLVSGFVAAMLVVLAAAGSFVYWRVEYALDRELNNELVDSSARLTAEVLPSGRLRDASTLSGGERYQVADANGTVLARDSPGPEQALLGPSVLRTASTEPLFRDIGSLLPGSRALRVYAAPLTSAGSGPAAVLVVAAERGQRDEALRELLAQLVVTGLATLLVTAVVGERLAKASLRPVERYRRQASDVAGGAIGVRLDVPPDRDDEITRLGHTLNAMLHALEEALEHERRFVNDASHELRTPLTLIGTRVQLARRRRRTVEEHEAVLSEIETDIDRLARLADQLLDMGRHRWEADPDEAVDIAVVVRAEVDRRRTLAPEESPYRQTSALEVLTSGRIPVVVPRSRLEQLVGNLLDNAAVHGLAPVTLTVDQVEETARLVVNDVGSGMDDEMLASAPERFARSPEARNRPGSGLGLSLVLAIVVAAAGELRLCCRARHERFGSRLPVTCDHGQEMTVTVLLPVSPAGASTSTEDPTSGTGGGR